MVKNNVCNDNKKMDNQAKGGFFEKNETPKVEEICQLF
jgi:hypothetical protein